MITVTLENQDQGDVFVTVTDLNQAGELGDLGVLGANLSHVQRDITKSRITNVARQTSSTSISASRLSKASESG